MKDVEFDQLCRSATSAAGIIQGKWRIPILCALQGGPVRLGRLIRLIPTASKKVMAENLRQLESRGVLVRTDLSGILLHVEYDYSQEFRPRITSMLKSLADVGELRGDDTGKTTS